MHILVLLQHYHTPDCATAARPWSLVRALATRHEVTLLTTRAWHERRLTYEVEWIPPGVRLHMLDVPYDNTMGTARRIGSFLSFAQKAVRRGRAIAPPDLIYGSSTPLTAAVAARLLARYWRVPWIFEVRDLWPDFPIQMGALDSPLAQRLLYALEHHLYRNAARVVTASPDMQAHVRRFTDAQKVSSVAYGTDFDLLDRATDAGVAALRDAHDLHDQHVVLHAGSFGRLYDIPTLLEAARRLQQDNNIGFVFAGRGHYRPLIEKAERSLPNVRLLDALPYHRTLALFRLAALSPVACIDRPVLAASAPSKLFDSLAAGTPVIVTNPGWTKAFVEKHDCGWHVPAGRPEALASRIVHVLERPRKHKRAGRNAAAAARQHFDRAVHMEKILSIIETVPGS